MAEAAETKSIWIGSLAALEIIARSEFVPQSQDIAGQLVRYDEYSCPVLMVVLRQALQETAILMVAITWGAGVALTAIDLQAAENS